MFFKKLNISKKMFLGFGVIILIMLLVVGNSYRNFSKESQAVNWNINIYEIIRQSDDILMDLLNMETGARGYVITGNESFLEPFNQGKDSYEDHYNKIKELTKDNLSVQQNLIDLDKSYKEWLKWTNDKIIVNREKVSLGQEKLEDVIALIQSGEGKEMMDNIRSTLKNIKDEEEILLKDRNDNRIKMEKETRAIMILGAVLGTIAALVIARLVVKMIVTPVIVVTNTFKEISEGEVDLEVRLKIDSKDELGTMARHFNIFMTKLKELIIENKNQRWLITGKAELDEEVRGVQKIDSLSSKMISYMCRYLDLEIGKFYINNGDNIFELSGNYASSSSESFQDEFTIGEGLVGQAALEKRVILIKNVPQDYMKITSGIIKMIPRNILIVPCIYHNKIECIIELGSFNEFTELQLKFIEEISSSIAVSINIAKSQIKVKELLDKTLVQAEELQVQQEELRQNNEELEEQAKILRQSEMDLQTQQEELRVSNEELEEQTKKLEIQKREIIKNNEQLKKAKDDIEEKAKELEIANKYKSEFLANMSHELRTPLNSIIVLSQLLENKKDNKPLTEKQLEYAKTIHSSGENLLNLINDILDLSKVEAGKMDVNFEKVNLVELTEDTKRLFSQMAVQKGIDLKINIENGMPELITSDRQKLQQIINNLLSNAIKFTNKGTVSMNILRPKASDIVTFGIKGPINKLIGIEVVDTGIGVPLNKQKLIFEAFKQVDGTISRKYGGTGLGLSISRELASLLGGTIYLKSQEGNGSIFTLVILDNEEDIINNNNQDEIKSYNSNLEEIALLNDNKLSPDNTNYKENLKDASKEYKKLLIVDENKEQTDIIYNSLITKGFSITIVESGIEAYKLIENEEFDCMILDLKIKEINGIELLNRLEGKNIINFPIFIHTENIITQEDEGRLNKYAESIIIKSDRSIERLLDEISLFFHTIDSQIDVEEIKHIESIHEKENSLNNKKILIVDDDMRNVFALTSALEGKGINVIVGRNGEEGIKKLYENSNVDLVLMDVMMPEMNGYTAMREIRKEKQFKNMPIIAITAKAMKDDRQKCIEAGANDYLTKPIDINKLISLLRVWLYR